MSKNFSTPKGMLHSPFDENIENGTTVTKGAASESTMKTNFQDTKDLQSPFIDEIVNPSHSGKVLR